MGDLLWLGYLLAMHVDVPAATWKIAEMVRNLSGAGNPSFGEIIMAHAHSRNAEKSNTCQQGAARHRNTERHPIRRLLIAATLLALSTPLAQLYNP